MAIEWAVIAAVVPHIRKYAADRVQALAGRYTDGVLAKAYRALVPDEKLAKANEAFVSRFDKELDSTMVLATLSAGPYQDALKVFLAHPSVQDEILAPLDGSSELNWEPLASLWGGLRLMELPADFDWSKVARTYRQSIQRQMLADTGLRPVVQAIAALRSADTLDRIAGPVRAFSLSRYAGAVKSAYAHLKLGAVETDWAQ